MNFDVSTMNCLGSWRVEWCWLQSPPLFCRISGVLNTIALLLHRISHVAHCVYILTKALILFILLLKMDYVELMVGKWRHALVSHILQNQTMDPRRWQIKQVDQDCAHVWKVDGGNGILLLWISLSFIWITWGHGYIIVYISSFFRGTWCVQFFSHYFFSFFWVMLLGHAIFLFFLIAHASFEGY